MSDRYHYITQRVIVRKHPLEARPLPPHADGMILDRDVCNTARITLTEPGHWQLTASPYAEMVDQDGAEFEAQVYWMGGRDL